jgi:hypothetical protein
MDTKTLNNERIFTLFTILFIATFSFFVGVIFAFYFNSSFFSWTIACFFLSLILFLELGIFLFSFYVEIITPKISGFYQKHTVKINYCVIVLVVIFVLLICYTQMSFENFKVTLMGAILATVLFILIDYLKNHWK